MAQAAMDRGSVIDALANAIGRLFAALGRGWRAIPWRAIFERLPLPMLALAASYGVFRFASFFAPFWVAVVQAAAFELTYIGLSATRDLTEGGRRRARYISMGAVAVSIIYNSLAGLFDRNPAWIAAMPWWAEWLLAILHGAPLALVSYLVADLLLHSGHSLSQVLEATIADLRSQLAGAAQTIADLTAAGASKDAALTDRDAQIAALSQQFADASRVAGTASQTAADLRAHLAECVPAAAARDADIAALRRTVADYEQQMRDAGPVFAAQQRAAADAARENGRLSQLLAAAQAELVAISQIGGVDVVSLARAARAGGATWPQLEQWTGIKSSTLRSRVEKGA